MAGINARLPLSIDDIDGAYALIRDYKEAVKQNLNSIILTSPGERIWSPNFGVGIRKRLFEQLTDYEIFSIRQAIEDQVRRYAPYVSLTKVEVYKISDLVTGESEKEQQANSLLVQLEYDVEISSTRFKDSLQLEVIQ